MTSSEISKKIKSLADPERAKILARYFKTGPGEYGEGDTFMGLKVPQVRKLAGEFKTLSLEETKKLLKSPIHEERLLSLFLLIQIFNKGNEEVRERVYRLYLENTRYINNWDLVDTSAPHIIGTYLFDKDRAPLYDLAVSGYLWERRMAIMATFCFIRNNQYDDTLRIAEKLLAHKEDLIHKAVGWMLREVGKRDIDIEKGFLDSHYKVMPRTMLRYAIERFAKEERAAYLKGEM
ncbi:MAG: DNA alkylation repair protein [Deltaproteobacteria bacterium]|nr:DNA alkylation repair protein [Deltaproteobacteria bacterium]